MKKVDTLKLAARKFRAERNCAVCFEIARDIFNLYYFFFPLVLLEYEIGDSQEKDVKIEQDGLRIKHEEDSGIKLEYLDHLSSDDSNKKILEQDQSIAERGPRKNRTSPDADSKNIIKNYGKALCAFASSNLALPYIENVIYKDNYHEFDVTKFMEYLKQKKETTNSMQNIRQLLLEEEGDSEEEKAFKKMFKEVSIIFMKYYAVNWIFSGRLLHKKSHLKYRFKMLRRIQDPEHFTYLK